jgi:hypothetical protein
MRRLPLLIVAIACLHTAVRADDTPVASVEVPGIRDPMMRTYRGVVAGLDAFDEYHRLAPEAPPVRFRFSQKIKGAPYEKGLQVRIVGKGDATLIAVDDAGDFSVPRIAAAYEDDADVILNRKEDLFRAAPVVRTPGLAPDVLRLGDLRLNCQVTVAIVKHEVGFFARAAITTLVRTGDWCNIKDSHFAFPAPEQQAIASAYIVDGNRSAKVQINDKWSVMAPLGNPAWSDDALIHLTFAPAAPSVAQVAP